VGEGERLELEEEAEEAKASELEVEALSFEEKTVPFWPWQEPNKKIPKMKEGNRIVFLFLAAFMKIFFSFFFFIIKERNRIKTKKEKSFHNFIFLF